MSVSNTLLAVLAVLLVAGSGAAVTGLAQTDAGASPASVSDLEMEATAMKKQMATTMKNRMTRTTGKTKKKGKLRRTTSHASGTRDRTVDRIPRRRTSPPVGSCPAQER